MKKKYSKNYSIIAQTTSDASNWSVYSTNDEMATIMKGKDKVLPWVSYMFLTRSDSKNRTSLIYYYSKGTGINSSFETVINNIILSE